LPKTSKHNRTRSLNLLDLAESAFYRLNSFKYFILLLVVKFLVNQLLVLVLQKGRNYVVVTNEEGAELFFIKSGKPIDKATVGPAARLGCLRHEVAHFALLRSFIFRVDFQIRVNDLFMLTSLRTLWGMVRRLLLTLQEGCTDGGQGTLVLLNILLVSDGGRAEYLLNCGHESTKQRGGHHDDCKSRRNKKFVGIFVETFIVRKHSRCAGGTSYVWNL